MKSRVLLILPLIITALLFFSFEGVSQSDSTHSKATYFIAVHSGALLGERHQGTALSAALIQGVRYRQLHAGVGVGYDAYPDWRTAPVFGSVSFDFPPQRANRFFIQFNMGNSVMWNPMYTENDLMTYEVKDNFYLNPVLGYKIVTEKINVQVSGGYKFQRLEYRLAWGGSGTTYLRRDIARISLQLGFGFN
ncbi:MAG TPA: hypothetical protein VFO54_09020 [Chryseosolibacter sp.]|nr:hypothetical protein [Chryseosolibacter sp.]